MTSCLGTYQLALFELPATVPSPRWTDRPQASRPPLPGLPEQTCDPPRAPAATELLSLAATRMCCLSLFRGDVSHFPLSPPQRRNQLAPGCSLTPAHYLPLHRGGRGFAHEDRPAGDGGEPGNGAFGGTSVLAGVGQQDSRARVLWLRSLPAGEELTGSTRSPNRTQLPRG